MIVTTFISNRFLDYLTEIDFNQNEKLISFLRELIDDKSIYFCGDKSYFNILKRKHKSSAKYEKNLVLLSYIFQKSSWYEIDPSLNYKELNETIIPIDLNLSQFSDDDLKNLRKKVKNIKLKFFKLTLNKGQNGYVYNQDELNFLKKCFSKVIRISKKILIWDQYIPDSLVKINRYTYKLEKNIFFKDYCSTLKFLDDQIFSKKGKDHICEILTMNKLEKNKYFEKSRNFFEPIVKEYIQNLKSINATITIKKYDQEDWDIKHSRLILFKDLDDQLLAYCVVEQGMDFIKEEAKNHYQKSFKKRIYTFTPGADVNFDQTIMDIAQISEIEGKTFVNYN